MLPCSDLSCPDLVGESKTVEKPESTDLDLDVTLKNSLSVELASGE